MDGNNKIEPRQSNFEILRIIAIFMIICFHYALKGGWNFEAGSFRYFAKNVFLIFGELGVNLFMLITGYFMCKSQRKWKNVISICLESIFYTFCIHLILCGRGWFSFGSFESWLKILFPDIFGFYWYVTAYIAIYIISPYINKMINAMDKKLFQEFLIVVLSLWCVIPSIFQFYFGTTETCFYYTRFIWLIIIYCMGAYIRIFGLGKIDSAKQSGFASLFVFALMLIFLLIANNNPFFLSKIINHKPYFWPPNTILMTILSVCFFNIFKFIKVKYIPILNRIASTTLGVYIMHDGALNGLIWNFTKTKLAIQISRWGGVNFIFNIFLGAIFVLAITVCIDLLRKYFEKKLIQPKLEIIFNSKEGVNMKGIKINWDNLIKAWIIFFAVTRLAYIMQLPIDFGYGEYDDYTAMTASLMNDQNFTISENDIQYYKKLFPVWANRTLYFSPYHAKNGDELAWYAPIYSLFCIPFVLLMKILNLGTSYAFRLANLFFIIFSLIITYKKTKLPNSLKLLLIIVLSINPIVFLLVWPSAELFIYSTLLLSIIFFINKDYYKSALFCSLAASMNCVILGWGALITLWFLYELGLDSEHKFSFKEMLSKKNQIIKYCLFYIIALFPLVFNFYQVGHINLSAKGMTDHSIKSIIGHFFAYFFDLNFGFLPYFSILMVLVVIFCIFAICKKDFKFLTLFIGLCGTTLGYSFMVHINCGMDGIARYNSWNSVFICIMAVYGIDRFVHKHWKLYVYKTFTIFSLILSIAVLYNIKNSGKNYTDMLPIANYFLENHPALYNPLYSTFNSRVNHKDGAYNYKQNLPIIFSGKDGYIRKILVSPETVEQLKIKIAGERKFDEEWLQKKLSNLKSTSYISAEKKHNLIKVVRIPNSEATTILLSTDDWNASDYIEFGISGNEKWGTWTHGNELKFFPIKISDYSPEKSYSMTLLLAGIYNGTQNVIVYENNNEIYNNIVSNVNEITFPIIPDENGIIKISIHLPDAISPKTRGESEDSRDLALALTKIVIQQDQ